MLNLPNLSGVNTFVIDTETTGLDWKRDKVVGYVIAVSPKDSWYFPVRHTEPGNRDPGAIESWISDLVNKQAKRIVGHNLKFDIHMLANHGIHVPHHVALECTQVNHALIDENAGHFDLDSTGYYFNVDTAKSVDIYKYLADKFGGDPNKKQMANFHKLQADDPVAGDYAIRDGLTTYQTWEAQQSYLDEENLRTVWGVECRCIRTLYRMERRGVGVNIERMDRLESRLEEMREIAMKALPRGINVRSPKDVKNYLVKCGITDWPMTAPSKTFPAGQPSFPEQWLSTLPEGQNIITVRRNTNLINSFIKPLRERHLFKGRVHTNFNQLKREDYGVVSGRLSSSAPNMQQVPKRDKLLAPMFRHIFLPERGSLWSANDYVQQEFVVFTEYTKSPYLVKGYMQNPPVDAHQSVANLLGVERDPTAKRMNLGMIYGMGVPTLAEHLNIPRSKAAEYRREYDRRIPEARSFLKDAERTARRRGYVLTKLKRRRRFPNPKLAHKAGNQIIQGTSADITKLKMVEIDEYFYSQGDDCSLMLQVHDELDWNAPLESHEQNQAAIDIMASFGENDLIPLEIPLRVESLMMSSWGEATFPHFDWRGHNGE